jgi:hypothetical protein
MDTIIILPCPTSWLLHIVASIFNPVLLQVGCIASCLLLFRILICYCNRLPAVLTVRQYLANNLYKNPVLVINSAFPTSHDYGGRQKASQGDTTELGRRVIEDEV